MLCLISIYMSKVGLVSWKWSELTEGMIKKKNIQNSAVVVHNVI